MVNIDLNAVAKKYNSMPEIWDKDDIWHLKTKEMIREFIFSSLNRIGDYKQLKILNVGSAGNSYGLNERNIIHIDIASAKFVKNKNACVANSEFIPLKDNLFDLIICVGSVINYCDPIIIFQEFRRLLKQDGNIILEFENSFTFELIGKKDFNKSSVFMETFYNGSIEKIWYFSETFIDNLAKGNGFEIIEKGRCHIISPLIFRIFKKENVAARFSSLDKICLKIPIIRKFSSNVIGLYKKQLS